MGVRTPSANEVAIPTHEDFHRDETPQGSSNRTFGFVIAAALLIVSLWLLRDAGGIRWWLTGIAGVVAALAILRPATLAPFNRVWTLFSLLLNRITSPLVMAAMFYGVITPAGLILRALGKDPLKRAFDPDAQSYWVARESPGPERDTMRNQF